MGFNSRRKAGGSRVYNVLFPVWMLVWFPSWLWLALIPGNYLIDRLVLRWSLSGRDDRDPFCRAHAWKICLAGFAADLIASLGLLAASIVPDMLRLEWLYAFSQAVTLNPFMHAGALAFTLLAIAIAGALIYAFDRGILSRAGLDADQAKASALRLAIITAPYLFLLPTTLLYR
ncbi:MAG: hypothetical protein IJH87_04940 [Atopobiaceae bacterium]|nr:hypothetical protein [Atopobiaceae bacterium]